MRVDWEKVASMMAITPAKIYFVLFLASLAIALRSAIRLVSPIEINIDLQAFADLIFNSPIGTGCWVTASLIFFSFWFGLKLKGD